MIKKRMKVNTEELWDKYKLSLTMAFFSGLLGGLSLALVIIRWGMAIV